MLRFLGKKSIAAAIPLLATLAAVFDIPGLQGQILALSALILNFKPPTLAGFKLSLANVGLALPKFDPGSVALILPTLTAKLGLLKLKLELFLEVTNLLLAAGVHVYRYEGPAEGLGSETAAEFVPGPSTGGIEGTENVYAVLLVVEASAGVTVTAMKRVFEN